MLIFSYDFYFFSTFSIHYLTALISKKKLISFKTNIYSPTSYIFKFEQDISFSINIRKHPIIITFSPFNITSNNLNWLIRRPSYNNFIRFMKSNCRYSRIKSWYFTTFPKICLFRKITNIHSIIPWSKSEFFTIWRPFSTQNSSFIIYYN